VLSDTGSMLNHCLNKRIETMETTMQRVLLPPVMLAFAACQGINLGGHVTTSTPESPPTTSRREAATPTGRALSTPAPIDGPVSCSDPALARSLSQYSPSDEGIWVTVPAGGVRNLPIGKRRLKPAGPPRFAYADDDEFRGGDLGRIVVPYPSLTATCYLVVAASDPSKVESVGVRGLADFANAIRKPEGNIYSTAIYCNETWVKPGVAVSVSMPDELRTAMRKANNWNDPPPSARRVCTGVQLYALALDAELQREIAVNKRDLLHQRNRITTEACDRCRLPSGAYKQECLRRLSTDPAHCPR